MTEAKSAWSPSSRSFIVSSGFGGGSNTANLFRITDITDDVPHSAIEELLWVLPVRFTIRREASERDDSLNEALDVEVASNIVSIFPPKRRVLTCMSLAAPEHNEEVSKLHIDNVMDMEYPGNGQIRTCIHLDPTALGVTGWPRKHGKDIEIDIHVYPKGKEKEPNLEMPGLDVRDILNLITGDDNKNLTVDQLSKWRGLIMVAVRRMRWCYENPDVAKDYPMRVYYEQHWKEVDAAAEDDAKLIEALNSLRSAIKWK